MDVGAGPGNGHRILDGVHRRKATKRTKQQPNEKKPIRVVYISNPMKVQTSASEFMALVQELTGQDAEFPDPSKFPPAADAFPAPVLLHTTAAGDGYDDDDVGGNLMMMNNNNSPSLAVELPAEDDHLLGSFYDDFDDLVFPPPVIGNFTGLLPAAGAVIYDSYAR